MITFTEVVKLVNGQPLYWEQHRQRMRDTIRHFFQQDVELLPLEHYLPAIVPSGLCKCRLIYNQRVEDVELLPYTLKQRKRVAVAVCDEVDYRYKYLDRTHFDQLLKQTQCDDVLIVKDGLLTDSCFANIVLARGETLVTPRLPLLRGTCRERYLQQGLLVECDIKPNDLPHFDTLYFINAMMELYECKFPVSQLEFAY